jgi:hypothetical protein
MDRDGGAQEEEVSKHTPGPWTVEIGMDAKVRCPDGRTFNIGDAIYHEENKDNARLVAAAPDMLAALRVARCYVKAQHGLLVGAIGEDNMISPDLRVIDAAITKAEAE